ncbi:hypothetical protein [Oligosphaera ethanolica]|uniref:Uncharacterized protein n=1 Tax=Oligosphaera ethanolica TaxID=760260 RepID=A0AAE3VI05_9BACT|nr:hypothetical protein [Oligosphaera ethanolica]MDQ0291052.1 hypothetical protein [Oligosphaera ethanolica]
MAELLREREVNAGLARWIDKEIFNVANNLKYGPGEIKELVVELHTLATVKQAMRCLWDGTKTKEEVGK